MGNDCAHAHYGAPANYQGLARLPLLNDSASAYVSMIFDDHIAVALYSWRKSNKVANYAIMLNITVQVRMKMPADSYITGQGNKGA